MGSRDVDIFKSMLYADVFRGEHSTGVMSLFRPFGKEPELRVRKAALPADLFLRHEKLWEDVSSLTTVLNNANKSKSTVFPKVMVGHNRHATLGQITDRNAHPFQHGKIILVHNGTLVDQDLLPDSDLFQVDSENIAWSIDKIGIDETVQKLDGAYTLVWINTEEQTLNIIRNKERPFHIVETTGGDWFGASEKDMLFWLINRKKYGPNIKQNFECKPGVQYVFDISSNMKFKEEREHKLPTFQKTYTSYGWGGNYSSYYSGGYSSSCSSSDCGSNEVTTYSDNVRHKAYNELLKGHGIDTKMGQKLVFEAYQIEPYPNNQARGKMMGYTSVGEYVEVQAHGVDVGIFEGGHDYVGEIISCYEQNYILTIIIKEPKKSNGVIELTPDNSNSQTQPAGTYTDDEELDVTWDGQVYSRSEWEGNEELNKCGECGSSVIFDEICDAVVIKDKTLCPDCVKKQNEDRVSNVLSLRKVIQNGLSVTPKQWEEINTCGWCAKTIPWMYAETTEFVGERPCCVCCSDKLDMGIIPNKMTED